MNILIVDDEPIVLSAMTRTVRNVLPAAEIRSFTDAEEALDYAAAFSVDLAFLDINMRYIDGITVARRLNELHPKINIIFCTGYAEYALEALKVYCSGFLLKPATEDMVRDALIHLRHPLDENAPLLRLKVFGCFEAYDKNGTPLSFRRSRAKELLAILAHFGGKQVSAQVLSETLFGENLAWDKKDQNYFYQQMTELMRVLRDAGGKRSLRAFGSCYLCRNTLCRFLNG